MGPNVEIESVPGYTFADDPSLSASSAPGGAFPGGWTRGPTRAQNPCLGAAEPGASILIGRPHCAKLRQHSRVSGRHQKLHELQRSQLGGNRGPQVGPIGVRSAFSRQELEDQRELAVERPAPGDDLVVKRARQRVVTNGVERRRDLFPSVVMTAPLGRMPDMKGPTGDGAVRVDRASLVDEKGARTERSHGATCTDRRSLTPYTCSNGRRVSTHRVEQCATIRRALEHGEKRHRFAGRGDHGLATAPGASHRAAGGSVDRRTTPHPVRDPPIAVDVQWERRWHVVVGWERAWHRRDRARTRSRVAPRPRRHVGGQSVLTSFCVLSPFGP